MIGFRLDLKLNETSSNRSCYIERQEKGKRGGTEIFGSNSKSCMPMTRCIVIVAIKRCGGKSVVILAGKLLRRARHGTRVTIIIRNLKRHKFAQGYNGERCLGPAVDEKKDVEIEGNKN